MSHNKRGKINQHALYNNLNNLVPKSADDEPTALQPTHNDSLQLIPVINDPPVHKQPAKNESDAQHRFEQQSLNQLQIEISQTKMFNNMYEQVQWFNEINLYEVITKIAIVWVISLFLFLIQVSSLEIYLCVSVLSFFLFGLHHNIFGSGAINKWAQASLIGTTFVLANVLLIKVLNLISSRVAQVLYYSHFTLIPAFITTCLLTVTYFYSPFLMTHKQRTYSACFRNYFISLSQLMIKVYSIRMLLLQVYAVIFLTSYVFIASLRMQQITANGASYISLLNPVVFVAKLVVYFIILVLAHGLVYFVSQPIFWALIPILYNTTNHYTRIPVILQLLKVTSTEQINKQLKKQGLLPSFNIFSMAESRKSNNLTRKKQQSINKHALAFIINLLTQKTNKINSQISIYSSINCANVSQPKCSISYWDILSQFINRELDQCLNKLYDMQRSIHYVHIEKEKNKSIFQDLLYLPRIKMLEIQLWKSQIIAAQYLNITDYILEILSIKDINLALEVGCSAKILSKIKEINALADKICGVFWLNQIVHEKIMKLYHKTNRIIQKTLK